MAGSGRIGEFVKLVIEGEESLFFKTLSRFGGNLPGQAKPSLLNRHGSF
jgi:hypothetical protein